MLSGKKTYIVVVGGLLVVVGGFLQGQLDLAEAINQAVLLLGVGGLRAGVGGQ
jgi:hypothetical protein